MADPVSALHGHLTSRQPKGANPTPVAIGEVTGFTITQIACWPDTLRAAGKIAAETAGSIEAPGPGRAIAGDRGTLLRLEPLKWWLIQKGDGVAPSLDDDAGALLDLTASRTWLRLSGAKATTLLNHFLPLDLSSVAFPDGAVASTAFHHVGVTLWREFDGFNLLLPRSFAASLSELLMSSAGQYGFDIT